jgi:hypothetical protein
MNGTKSPPLFVQNIELSEKSVFILTNAPSGCIMYTEQRGTPKNKGERKMTRTQIERAKNEIKELTAKLDKATAKLNRTIEIMKEDASWEMFLEEDKKRVDYYTRHINRLNTMIEGVI